MLIKYGQTIKPNRIARQSLTAAKAESDHGVQSQDKVDISIKEKAVTSAILSASVGSIIGEKAGQAAFAGGAGYAGYQIGQSFGGPLAGIAGAAIGVGAAALFELKVKPVSGSIGAAAGFVTGGIVGGVAGAAIGGIGRLGQIL